MALPPTPARPTRQRPPGLAARTARTTTSDTLRLRRALPDLNVAVKPEPVLQAAPEVLVEYPLAQDRTAFFAEVSRYCDLTGPTPQWQMELSAQPALVLSHRMEPDPRLDAAFPLRDPAQPLTHVHARYANADGSLSEHVGCAGVTLNTGFYNYLRSLGAKRDGRLPVQDAASWTKLVHALERDMMSEIQRLIAGTPAQPPRCAPRRISEQDLPEIERAALAGQYGLFVDDALESTQRPLLSNGKVLGVYMGALLETEEELRQYHQEHPTSEQYEMNLDQVRPEPAVVAALGAANSTAFANTALSFKGDRPDYDHERLNAIFLPFRAQMTDNAGQAHDQSFMALVALDNLYGSGNPSREVRVDYGDAYLQQFKKHPSQECVPPTPSTPPIKTEPREEPREPDVAMADAALQAADTRERSPAAAMPAARRRRLDDSGRYPSDQSASSCGTSADSTGNAESEGRAPSARRRVPVRLTIDTQIAHEAWPDPDIASDESSADREAQGAGDAAVIAAIRQAVPGPYKSKTKHYEAILDVNDTRAHGQKWPDKSMQEVVGFDAGDDFLGPNDQTRREKKRELEAKLILSSNVKGWNVSENFIAEKNLAHAPFEFGYAIGINRPLALAASPRPCALCRENFRAGLELYGGLGTHERFGFPQGTSHYIAPTVAWQLPNGLTFQISPAFGMTGPSSRFLLRTAASYEISQFGRSLRRMFR